MSDSAGTLSTYSGLISVILIVFLLFGLVVGAINSEIPFPNANAAFFIWTLTMWKAIHKPFKEVALAIVLALARGLISRGHKVAL